jgi:hypothetical protein
MTMTTRRRAGTSGRARSHQPPRPWRGGGGLVARSDTSAALERPADGVGPSSLRAGPSTRLEQGQEGADAPPAHYLDAQTEQGLWEELRDHGASLNRALWIHGSPHVAHLPGQLNFVEFRDSYPAFSLVLVFSDACTSRSACWWEELERRARERYAVLDRLDADSRWYRG